MPAATCVRPPIRQLLGTNSGCSVGVGAEMIAAGPRETGQVVRRRRRGRAVMVPVSSLGARRSIVSTSCESNNPLAWPAIRHPEAN